MPCFRVALRWLLKSRVDGVRRHCELMGLVAGSRPLNAPAVRHLEPGSRKKRESRTPHGTVGTRRQTEGCVVAGRGFEGVHKGAHLRTLGSKWPLRFPSLVFAERCAEANTPRHRGPRGATRAGGSRRPPGESGPRAAGALVRDWTSTLIPQDKKRDPRILANSKVATTCLMTTDWT